MMKPGLAFTFLLLTPFMTDAALGLESNRPARPDVRKTMVSRIPAVCKRRSLHMLKLRIRRSRQAARQLQRLSRLRYKKRLNRKQLAEFKRYNRFLRSAATRLNRVTRKARQVVMMCRNPSRARYRVRIKEFHRSFRLQYLQLQQKLRQENREFNLMSNVMKAKHDTAKNALNNIR